MASTFTNFDVDGFDWSDKAFLNEFVSAYNERNAVASTGAITPWNGGDLACKESGNPSFNLLQTNLESMCTGFVNHDATIVGESAVPMFSLATWRAEAGMSSGFRRATTWPTNWKNYADAAFNYGKMQDGDIIGPWIFDDLQKGLASLQWTVDDGTKAFVSSTLKSEVGGGGSCAVALADYNSNWTSGSWGAGSFVYLVLASIREDDPTPTFWAVRGAREYGSTQMTSIDVTSACSIDLYCKPQHYNYAGVEIDFLDIDSKTMTENALWFWETLASAQTATRNSSTFTSPTTEPLAVAGFDCSNVGEGAAWIQYSDVFWIHKWGFAYHL